MSPRHAPLLLSTLLCLLGCGDDTAPASAAAITPAPAQTSVASNDPGVPAMLDLTIASSSLGRDVKVRLVLPRDYDAAATRTYPVLYLLHGANEPLGYRAWSEQTAVETLAAARGIIVAMPEGGDVGWYSDWSGACVPDGMRVDDQPRWERFHTEELPAVLRAHFHASTRSAIAGLSMGGFGASSYAARHPGMYSAVASYSGALRTATNPLVLQLSLLQAGCSNQDAVWGNVTSHADVWAAHDPYQLADKLQTVPLYVAAGNGQPGPLDVAGAGVDPLEALAERASRDFAERLQVLGGAKLVTNFYGPGGHSWPYWARELAASFPLLTDALVAP